MEQTIQWSPTSLPFETNYNDHFETPMQAYLDVKPVLDWFSCFADHSFSNDHVDLQTCISNSTDKSLISQSSGTKKLTLYDPYYCNGKTAIFLKELGYEVVHEARDFYLDIANNEVPQYDVFISNPPYSDTHKIQCLDYCFRSFRKSIKNGDKGKIFLLLMPSYTATKQYFRDRLSSSFLQPCDILYLIPSTSYKYDHPQGTGKDHCPFNSLWFCIIGSQKIDSLMQHWESIPKWKNQPFLSKSLSDLIDFNLIARKSRPNPRTRKKIRKEASNKMSKEKNGIFEKPNCNSQDYGAKNGTLKKILTKDPSENSIYRDPISLKRQKKRF